MIALDALLVPLWWLLRSQSIKGKRESGLFPFLNFSKKLVAGHGILTLPNKKKGKTLECKTEALVTKFYQRDDYMSRLMPGMKDCVSVRIDGKKVPMQKRMVL